MIRYLSIIFVLLLSYILMGYFDAYRAEYQSNKGMGGLIAGSFPNALSVILGCLLIILAFGAEKFPQNVSLYTLGLICYEVLQIYSSSQTFDEWDVLITLVFYVGALFFYFAITRLSREVSNQSER
ncbi:MULTISPECIES: hypothetical protein [Microbulbifer]|nr:MULTISPECIES: hypothetical protein [Microbulbifer]